MTNPLVAPTKDSTTATSGIALLDDARTLSTAIESGDWAAGVLGVAGTAMDALMVVADPFGAIFAAGVGWLMEHVGPLKEALDKLAGNPDAITAHSQTWQNISDELGNIAQDLKNQVTSDLGDWQGAAADAYRQKASDLGTLLGAAQEATAGTSKGVKTAGEVVAAVRQLVRDTIAQVVGHMVSWALQVVLTLGIGLAWVVPQVATLVGKTATQIAKLVKNLTTAMKALTKLLSKAGGIFDDAAKGLKNVAPGSASKGGKVGDLPSGPKNVDPVRGDTTTPSSSPNLPKDTPDKVSAPPKLGDTTTPSSSPNLPKDAPDKVSAPPKLDSDGATTPSSAGGSGPTTSRGLDGPATLTRSPDTSAAPVHGVRSTANSILDRINGVFTPPDKVRPGPVKGVTTESSFNANTIGASGFARSRFPYLNKLNPSKDKYNCTQTITAVDHMLGGKFDPAKPLPKDQRIGANFDVHHPLRQKNRGGTPVNVESWDDVISKAREVPDSKGYVIAYRSDRSAHVMNVVNTREGVVFLDGQTGKLGKLDKNIDSLTYFRYDPPNTPTPSMQSAPSTVSVDAVPDVPAPTPAATNDILSDIDPVYLDWLRADEHFNGGGNKS